MLFVLKGSMKMCDLEIQDKHFKTKPKPGCLFISQLWQCLYWIRKLLHSIICSPPSPSYFSSCCLVLLSGSKLLSFIFFFNFLVWTIWFEFCQDSVKRASEKAGTDVSYYMDMVPEELVLVVGIECLWYCSTNTSCHTFHRLLGSVVSSHTPIIHRIYDGAALYAAGGRRTSRTICFGKGEPQGYSTAANYSSHICWLLTQKN